MPQGGHFHPGLLDMGVPCLGNDCSGRSGRGGDPGWTSVCCWGAWTRENVPSPLFRAFSSLPHPSPFICLRFIPEPRSLEVIC